MPQMAPIWWTTMFMMFIVALLLVMTINYFNVKYKSTSNKNIKIDSNHLYWKW
uniref:ATP synthase complex subunit 8 n=1 Tax=Nabicula flavomarginata TaxID=1656685 RepID=A0A343ISB6_9HEMI|nr:ATP synthase F0 subunit 8 [Nabicula flavomarginata]AST10128.1 ATP synthase F0 subunit 8 [Nabicula flavomarginata]